ncbi:hypothetical protein EAF00_009579 [Botryotinia globosa]|nr:hypothetical protein EAF00_009579 [Botryotinia globosa]
MCLALQSYSRNNDIPPEYQETLATVIDLYRIRTAQCLIIADITRPVNLMIETMLCYAFIEYAIEQDGDMGWEPFNQLIICWPGGREAQISFRCVPIFVNWIIGNLSLQLL